MSGTAGATRDSLWQGRLTLWQPARGEGYRFNLDPVLLAGFVEPARRVVDLGAGCGILGLLLLRAGRAERVFALELQPQLAALARRNGEENGLGRDRLEVVCGDLRQTDIPAAEAVVFNPPYFPEASGRPAPNAGRDAARHERHGTLADFVAAAASALVTTGTLYAIVPAPRGEELSALCREAGLATQHRRSVVPRDGEPPNHLLLAARRGEATVIERPPLVIHAGGREFTAEVQAWVDGPEILDPTPQPRRAR